jgi:hypothetical protein
MNNHHSPFFEFEDSDQDASERSTQFKPYLPNRRQHVASVKCPSTINDGSLPTLLPNREMPTSSTRFDDLDELLYASPSCQTNQSCRKFRRSASFDAVNRVTLCHTLLIFAKRCDLLIRVFVFRKKRRYSFDLTSSDFGFELSSANNQKKGSPVKSQLSSAKIVQNKGVKSTALFVLLLSTLCFLWSQIMKTAIHRVDSQNKFRGKSIQRIVLPIHSMQQKKSGEEDAQLVDLKERPEVKTAMKVDLLEEELSDVTQDKKLKREERLTREHLAPVDMLPSFTDVELQEEHIISLPPSFEYLANFTSARQPGDIPVVSFLRYIIGFSLLITNLCVLTLLVKNIVLAHSKIWRVFSQGYLSRLLSNDSSRRNGIYLKPNSEILCETIVHFLRKILLFLSRVLNLVTRKIRNWKFSWKVVTNMSTLIQPTLQGFLRP